MTPNQTLGGGAVSVADVLERAADLIEPEGAWTQGVFARDARGLDPEFDEGAGPAVCWCADGALMRAACDHDTWLTAADALATAVGGSVWDWNDAPERTQAEVVAKLREAAALAREQSR